MSPDSGWRAAGPRPYEPAPGAVRPRSPRGIVTRGSRRLAGFRHGRSQRAPWRLCLRRHVSGRAGARVGPDERGGNKERSMEGREEDVVRIFDTTLRDGEQSPGATMNGEEKLAIARQLEELGVDVIEAGFAASSEGAFEAVSAVAGAVAAPVIVSLARTKEADILRAAR